MLLYPHRRFFLYNTNNNNINTILMAASKHLLLPFNSTTTNNITTTTSTPPPFAATATTTTTTTATFISSSSQSRLFNTTTTTTRNHRRRLIFYSLSSRTFSSTPRPAIPRPVLLEELEQQVQDSAEMRKLRQKLEEFGIDGDFQKPGQYTHLICPKCGGGHSMEKSLSLFIEQDGNTAVWICHRAKCGWKGGTRASTEIKSAFGNLNMSTTVKQPKRVITETSLELQPLCNELLAYFAERMISKETLRRNSVMQRRYGNQIVIAFTYRKNGVLVNCKYRDISKRFWQESNTEKIFYGLDDIKGASDIIIVEGEMDKLAMEEAGFCSCVSVPDGAPPSVSPKEVPSQEKDKKYQYLWNCKEYLQKASRIILATDGDPPGQALAEELARRLGRERCWRVRWPKKDSDRHFKDANEVLMHLGPGALREVIEHAELYPIQGLFNFSDYFSEIDAYYRQSLGFELGVSTGWRSLNDLYNVVPGELTVVTGVPNSGKSEWIDALLCNLNHSVGWKFALCLMENKVQEHARKLLEKHIKKPFFDVRYGESAERMSVEELEQGKEWLSDTFSLIRCENDCLPDIDWVLELAKAAVLRHGVNGLVIDLYNELDHQRPPSQIETEYVSQMLTKIKRFAQHHSCHVWFVAHPRQLHHWVGSPPNLYDISGSAHFINKFDNGIVDKDPIRIEQRIKHRGDPLGGSSGVGSGSHAPPSTAPLSDNDRLIEAMSQMQIATNRRINAWGKSLRKQINDLGRTTQNDMETVRIQVSNLNSWADGYTAWIQEHGGKPPIPPDESYVPPQPEYQEYQDELDDEDGEEDDADEEED